MTVDEAIEIAETALNYDRLNKVQELVFRQSWEGRSYGEIAKTTGYQYDYIKATGYELWKLLSQVLGEKVKQNNLKSVLKRYLRKTQVNLQRNLTIEVNLSGANLSGANLSGARLFANLNEADYVQTDLDKIINTDSATELSNSENEINWNGFCFHSDAQVKIAEILDRTSTLFIPNSQLRLATPAGRQNQEADFLIFHQNKLGMLKIDRESSHPNATED
ncbi:pentapeptide repeat-containing protein [Microcoleus sp. F8-D3]